ncbi:hypothetical protein [Dyadobacter arcticus]|uniref:Nucleic acid-binding protein n=1 Tax=Dyadobacter arcticus TaxID=1078754 RepID=A0ABX0UNP7_9BACT|nr:hypothetical protein [Dyadobacter arcticus]NIJ54616.1 putative nucleic acid-binding protein [Dyadobacter arcticus]
MIDQLFEELDAELPDVEMSSQEIQDEINAYRNEKNQKAYYIITGDEDLLVVSEYQNTKIITMSQFINTSSGTLS